MTTFLPTVKFQEDRRALQLRKIPLKLTDAPVVGRDGQPTPKHKWHGNYDMKDPTHYGLLVMKSNGFMSIVPVKDFIVFRPDVELRKLTEEEVEREMTEKRKTGFDRWVMKVKRKSEDDDEEEEAPDDIQWDMGRKGLAKKKVSIYDDGLETEEKGESCDYVDRRSDDEGYFDQDSADDLPSSSESEEYELTEAGREIQEILAGTAPPLEPTKPAAGPDAVAVRKRLTPGETPFPPSNTANIKNRRLNDEPGAHVRSSIIATLQQRQTLKKNKLATLVLGRDKAKDPAQLEIFNKYLAEVAETCTISNRSGQPISAYCLKPSFQ